MLFNYVSMQVLRECTANAIMGVPIIRKWRVNHGRTTSALMAQQVQLALAQFSFFIDAIGWENIQGKTIIEIGPGDSIPLGLLFLGAGVKKYVAVDRFLGDVSGPSAKHIYHDLIKSAPERLSSGWANRGLDAYKYPDWEPDDHRAGIRLIRKSIEDIDIGDYEQGEILISFNVIEHLQNVRQAAKNMADMLVPGGIMLHRVDYGPHAFRHKNPLMFLTITRRLWSIMGSNRGLPNRLRHSQILEALEFSGFKNADRITHRFDIEDLEPIRSKLCREFIDLKTEDLLVADAEVFSSIGISPRLVGHAFSSNRKDKNTVAVEKTLDIY
jgi:hypothetical protein